MKSLSGVVNKIMCDNCKCADKRRGCHEHGSGSLPKLHQAVTWSLTSPLYNDTLGIYVGMCMSFKNVFACHNDLKRHKYVE